MNVRVILFFDIIRMIKILNGVDKKVLSKYGLVDKSKCNDIMLYLSIRYDFAAFGICGFGKKVFAKNNK